MDNNGENLRNVEQNSVNECAATNCSNDPSCTGFIYDKNTRL